MASSNPYYDQWKQQATYSKNFTMRQTEDEEYKGDSNKFWGCTDQDWQTKQRQMEEQQSYDPKTTIKNQFILDKTASLAPVNKYVQSQEFQTSNNVFHSLTETSKATLNQTQNNSNPALEQLHPEVFEVSAKRNAPIWKTEQYKDESLANLNQTTNRGIQNYDEEIAQKMRITNHNIKVTNISEYSNALNRGSVFINPKFSSC